VRRAFPSTEFDQIVDEGGRQPAPARTYAVLNDTVGFAPAVAYPVNDSKVDCSVAHCRPFASVTVTVTSLTVRAVVPVVLVAGVEATTDVAVYVRPSGLGGVVELE
jgi:hypothetical protein